MRKMVLLLYVLAPTFLLASPESSARKMQAYLLVGDPKGAVVESKEALKNNPKEPLVYEWAIKSLAAAGEDDEMMRVWEEFHTAFEAQSLDQDLLEQMCWGILKKGQEAVGLSSQLISIVGAALAQDMRAVPFLIRGLRHSNAQIRTVTVELAALYGDYPLCQEMGRLFRQETILEVRLNVIKALGKMELEEYLPSLMQLVANPKTGPQEKLAAIEAIVSMRETIEEQELRILAESERAGLRELACEVMAHCNLKEQEKLLLPLLRDSHPEVCAAALKAWGLLRKKATEEIHKLAVEALDPKVGVTAAWVWLIDDPIAAETAMERWLHHEQPRVRALAASAVAAAGPYGVELAKKELEKSDDLYVQINLALALAGQRQECQKVCTILEKCLNECPDKWMFSEDGLFKTVEKSDVRHNPTIPNYPEVVNQTVRLELLNLLAILESPTALDAIKGFLKARHWGVTGLAAETLLGEGDETAIDLVKELLQDPDREVRLEAALVLASWGKDHSALPILLDVYPKADRQLQLKILESLGRIGDRQALPFLLNRLKEPSLLIRMVAACVLIQTLNH